jgi:hypothetical protein
MSQILTEVLKYFIRFIFFSLLQTIIQTKKYEKNSYSNTSSRLKTQTTALRTQTPFLSNPFKTRSRIAMILCHRECVEVTLVRFWTKCLACNNTATTRHGTFGPGSDIPLKTILSITLFECAWFNAKTFLFIHLLISLRRLANYLTRSIATCTISSALDCIKI